MASKSLIQAFQNLAVSTGTLLPKTTQGVLRTTVRSKNKIERYRSSWCLQQIKLPDAYANVLWETKRLEIQFRSFHTTGVYQRVLNRRMYPISRVPSKKGRWEILKPMRERYEYTVKPIPMPKLGGRGPNGRIWNWRSGGGNKRHFRMVDYFRCAEKSDEPLVEKVQKIMYDPNRSANIALVASGEHKRYIIATVNMKEGDLITSSSQLTDKPIRAMEGDAYPVGSLAMGTIVNSVELVPGDGSFVARAAGTQAQVVRKTTEHVILRMPSKREIAILPKCMATVGRVGNIGHNKIVIGKAGRNRWRGIRPKSGFFQKKTGRFGRKIKPPKSVMVYKGKTKRRDPMRPVPYSLMPQHTRPILP